MGMPETRFRRARILPSMALLGALLIAAGCASTLKLEPPQLSVVTMKVQSADILSQRLQLRLRVVNPNDRELPIKGITYRIEVEGDPLAEGLTDAPFVVPANGEAEFDMQVTANLAGTLARYLMRGSTPDVVNYRMVGKVALSSGFLRSIPFDERGSVKLK
jgi:LEA14-like dessication related protein